MDDVFNSTKAFSSGHMTLQVTKGATLDQCRYEAAIISSVYRIPVRFVFNDQEYTVDVSESIRIGVSSTRG